MGCAVIAVIHALGIDVGSTTAKIVGVDAAGIIVWHLLESTNPRAFSEEQVANRLEAFMEMLGI